MSWITLAAALRALPKAQSATVSATQTGKVATLQRVVGPGSTLSLGATSPSIFGLSGADLSLTGPIGSGAPKTATIIEDAGDGRRAEWPFVCAEPAALWTPAKLATAPLAWWDATDAATITLDGSNNVSAWANKGSAGSSASQATAGNRPAWSATGLNGAKPAVVFGGGTQQLAINFALPIGGADRWAFIVVQSTASSGSGRMLGWGGGLPLNGSALYQQAGQFPAVDWAGSNFAFEAKILTTPRIVEWTYTGGSNAGYVDGGTAVTATQVINTTADAGAIGRWPAFGNSWNGPICELLVFSYVPSAADQQKMQGYAAWKYGLQAQLPAGHPYRNAAP